MMQITVRLFATLRQEAGWGQREVSLPEGATLDDLLAALAAGESGLSLTDRPVYAAVNREYAQRGQTLHDGDVVAFFPPVSGG
jgi:molybdopterin converting factor subunit 1